MLKLLKLLNHSLRLFVQIEHSQHFEHFQHFQHLEHSSLLPSDAADIVAEVLIEAAHIAIAEVHAVGGDIATLGRRPIVVGLSV